MQKEIKIRNRVIAEQHPLFIVAECGVTCNYEMKIAKELIDVVRESGADAIGVVYIKNTKRFVDLNTAKEIFDALPVFLSKVIVCTPETIEEIERPKEKLKEIKEQLKAAMEALKQTNQ